MPYLDPNAKRMANREANRRYRAKKRAQRERASCSRRPSPPPPQSPVDALCEWAAATLKVPAGHTAVGEPMAVPQYFREFLDDAMQDGIREAGCFVARKNAKSAAVAILLLGHLAADGPLRRRGWRCGVASFNKEKATELWQQTADIGAASGLEGIRYGKVPRIIESEWGRVDVLSADKKAGHASGFDLVIADELGLFPEAGRQLMAGLLSSTSARDGRVIAISILGDSPLTTELIDRGGDPSCVVHVHRAPDGCELDDEAAWQKANPTLGTIKSREYMADMARRAKANPSEQTDFRVFDMNMPGTPSIDPIVPGDVYEQVHRAEQPPREGPVVVGIDLGGSTSMTAAALYWPKTGRIECYGAFGDDPDLGRRGVADGVGERYIRMQERGELRTYPGRVTPPDSFLAWIVEKLDGQRPDYVLADRYRQAEFQDAYDAADLHRRWGTGIKVVRFRGVGLGQDGAFDVRAFQTAVHTGKLAPGGNMLLLHAVVESQLRHDSNGNAALEKSRQRGRIDALSAAVLAVGRGSQWKPPRPLRSGIIG